MKKMRWRIAQFFEKQWWKNYLRGKTPDEYLAWKRKYWLEFLKKIDLDIKAIQGPVIDIGCGPAGIFMVLENKNVTAVDPLLWHYTKLPIFKTAHYPYVNFEGATFEKFESEEKYQTIFCLNAINHFIDIEYSFKKLFDMTKQGGQVHVSIDAHNHSFFRKILSLLPMDVLHPHQYYLEEYEEFLVKQGYDINKKVLIKKDWIFDYWVLIASKN
jgi:2-polyprenyl-6-hydroxyphenyl methylase/3-demethylubiquinone-9 3-methyltransferase